MRYRIVTIVRGTLAPLLACLFIAAATYAENSETAGGQQKNSLVKGAWALQFEIVGDVFNLDLDSFQGSTLSLKKHTSDRSAWRIGLGLGLALSDQDATRESDGDSDPATDYNADNESVNVIIQKVSYPSPTAGVNFFYGLGPVAGFSHRESTTKRESPVREYTNERFSWSVGASGVIGVEWFPTKLISVLAEYGSVLQYEWLKDTDKRLDVQTEEGTIRTVTENKGKSLSIRSSSVRLGLSFYF